MRFIVAAGLMVVCAGGIGRLLWLLEGQPPLDRPAWWPRGQANANTAAGSASRPGSRLAAVGACAACCGVPLLLLAGIAVSGFVATVSIVGALLLLAGLAAWHLAARRVTSSHHGSPATGSAVSCCATDDASPRGAEVASTNRHG
jgi:hypothetical protein